jgi:hypothetical protein
MEPLEDWGRLLQEIPGMIRFAVIFGGVVSLVVIGCLIAIAIQLGRMMETMREISNRNAPTIAAPGAVQYGPQPQHHPQAYNNPYNRP